MSDLQKRMDDLYKRKVEDCLEKAVRLTALSVFTEVVINTPVGNPDLWKNPAPKGYAGGTARQSWNIDINVVNVKITEAKDELSRSYDGSDKALAAIAKFKLNDTVYIANSVPYIRRLNDGWSTQAPAGFIDAAVQVGIRKGK